MTGYIYGSIAALQRATLRELNKADPGAEYAGFMGLDVLRAALWRYRGVQCPTLCQILGKAEYALTRAGCEPLNAEQVECLQDPTRAGEALDMLDDWEARLDLPPDIRADLSAWLVDNYNVHARG